MQKYQKYRQNAENKTLNKNHTIYNEEVVDDKNKIHSAHKTDTFLFEKYRINAQKNKANNNETVSDNSNNILSNKIETVRTNPRKYRQKINTVYTCKICDYNTKRKSDYKRHIDRRTCARAKKNGLFYCDVCNYESKFNSNYQKHLTTKKHKKNTEKQQCDANNNVSDDPQNLQISNPYNNETQDMVKVLIKQNQALQDKLLEIANQPKIVVNNNTQNNNQKNNIVQFLNNDCKDAVNLSDFISKLVVTFDDLETIENEGYVTSIKETLIKSLGDMKKETRPIHCTDVKRKQFYVKDNDKWEKEKNTNSKIYSALNDYNNKQVLTMQEWKSQNPGWAVVEEKQDKINRLTREVTSLSMIQNKLLQEIGEMTKICL
jgi:hypothetical protein